MQWVLQAKIGHGVKGVWKKCGEGRATFWPESESSSGTTPTFVPQPNAINRIFFALGAALLSLSAFAQQITVLQPNGGESIDGCTPYDIQWTAAGTSGEFNIDYSTDGGATWVSLASFLTNTTSFR